MREGGLEVLDFPSATVSAVAIYTNRLRSSLAHWTPPHHWSVRQRETSIIVQKLEPWESKLWKT